MFKSGIHMLLMYDFFVVVFVCFVVVVFLLYVYAFWVRYKIDFISINAHRSLYFRNTFNVWSVDGIMNTLGLLQSNG